MKYDLHADLMSGLLSRQFLNALHSKDLNRNSWGLLFVKERWTGDKSNVIASGRFDAITGENMINSNELYGLIKNKI